MVRMSTAPRLIFLQPFLQRLRLPAFVRQPIPRRVAAAVAALLAVLGISTIWSTGVTLWELWTADALKSIGMIVPVVSFLLILRVWRSLDWEMDGSWWGLALLVATAVVVRLREQVVMVFTLSPQWSMYFPPLSTVVFAYGVGVVLLFGGMRLVRAAIFPLFLLLLVNPVPHVFNVYVDLPLQRASALVARGFATALGQPLSADKLRLMFTPSFGMFIAPGCNGIRGGVTMGLIALIAGHLYRFRWRAHTLAVLAAIALGYVFNFVRLCVLVLYYLVALRLPWLQDRAETADYIIGAVLFLIAAFLLFHAIQRYGAQHYDAEQTLPPVAPNPLPMPSSAAWRIAAMSLLVGLGCAIVIHQRTAPGPSVALLADETSLGFFPDRIGSFTRVRSWNESMPGGALLFHWAEYAPDGGGNHVAMGISPVLGSHDTLICHSARGDDPIWHGAEVFPTADEPISFNTSLFNDGATQYVEATTLCTGSACGEYSTPNTHFGFVFSRPQARTLLSQDPERPIPILLKAETIDTTLPADAARKQLLDTVRAFLSAVRLDTVTRPYRRSG